MLMAGWDICALALRCRRLMADRCTKKELAARLFLSEGTVKQYTNLSLIHI